MNAFYNAVVKYLQTSGSQQINTGVNVANNDKLVVTYYGVTPLSLSGRYLQGFNTSTWAYWGVQNGYYEFGGTYNTVPIGENDTCVWTRVGGGQYASLVVNGQIVNETNSASSTTTGELQLFALLSLFKNGYWRIGRIVVNLNDVVVRDFIPVRAGEVGYMYDNVTYQLFGNASTGSFAYGPDISTRIVDIFSYGQNTFGKIAQPLLSSK